MNFHRRNLNLLVALDALIAEKNITRAAERLHLSQPAMSSAVARLREWLRDPLLVRGPEGYVLTPRAQELAVPLRVLLKDIDTLVGAKPFDPRTSTRSFHIAMTDASILLPRLLRLLAVEAPGIEVQASGLTSFPARALAHGELDVVIGSFSDVPPDCLSEKLFEGRPACAVRRDHPRIGKKLTLRNLAQESHVLAVTDDNMYLAFARNALAKKNISLRVAAQVSHFVEAAIIASQSDLIATVPYRLALLCENSFGMKVLTPPVHFPSFQVSQIWHERTRQSADHQWLRTVIHRIARDV